MYMLRDEVWAEKFSRTDQAHLRCAAIKLRRALTLDDFSMAPVNEAIRIGFEMGYAAAKKGKDGPQEVDQAAREN